MENLNKLWRAFFAIGLIAIAVQQLYCSDFRFGCRALVYRHVQVPALGRLAAKYPLECKQKIAFCGSELSVLPLAVYKSNPQPKPGEFN